MFVCTAVNQDSWRAHSKYPECIFVWRRRLNLMHCCNCLNCCSWRFAPLILFMGECQRYVSESAAGLCLESRLHERLPSWRKHWVEIQNPADRSLGFSCEYKTRIMYSYTPQPSLMISQWP